MFFQTKKKNLKPQVLNTINLKNNWHDIKPNFTPCDLVFDKAYKEDVGMECQFVLRIYIYLLLIDK